MAEDAGDVAGDTITETEDERPTPIGLLTGPTVLCPLDGCEWFHCPTPVPVYDTSQLDRVMGAPGGSINAIATQRFQDAVEREIRTHLRTHTVEQWMTTVGRLKKAAGELMVIQ